MTTVAEPPAPTPTHRLERSAAARPGNAGVGPRPGRSPGALLLSGEYRLGALLAVGGMGSVWSATHVALGRRVAVKFLDAPDACRDPFASRFLREARLAAAVHHPNVVDILDFGLTDAGEPVMVMELLDGETLAAHTRAGPRLTTAESVQVIAQVLSGLDAVHRAGVLHCDIKPANIVVERALDTNAPFARLLDFGVAYASDPRSELSRGRFGTDAHSVFGTPEYMSPEQAEGRTDLDERVDVYAISVISYELLSGISPFQDDHPGRVLFRVMLGSHVPLVTLRPDLPSLARVVERGMALERGDRFPSARALRNALLAASPGA